MLPTQELIFCMISLSLRALFYSLTVLDLCTDLTLHRERIGDEEMGRIHQMRTSNHNYISRTDRQVSCWRHISYKVNRFFLNSCYLFSFSINPFLSLSLSKMQGRCGAFFNLHQLSAFSFIVFLFQVCIKFSFLCAFTWHSCFYLTNFVANILISSPQLC